MKIVAFTGSPRKDGNTETLVKEILSGAQANEADIVHYDLAKMDIAPCVACMSCKKNDGCSQKDDMLPLLDEILSADAVIIGSPVYMWQMSAQTKLFTDRLFALLNTDYSVKFKPGLPLVLAYTQGQPDTKAFQSYFEHNAGMFKFMQFNVIDTIVAGGCSSKTSVSQMTDVMTKAKDLGRNLTKSVSC